MFAVCSVNRSARLRLKCCICGPSCIFSYRKMHLVRVLNFAARIIRNITLMRSELAEIPKEVVGLPVVHHHGYVCDLPKGHRFPMPKFHKVFEILLNDGIISLKKQVINPKQVSSNIACCVHTADYVDKFFNGRTTEEEQRVTGFTWSPGLASRVKYETGGTLLAAALALERGLACSTAGGTHHAFPDRGTGFCLINDLAVTAKWFLDQQRIARVLIVDLDVHQESLPYLLSTFKPDLVLYDAGVDPHKDDELGKLQLTDKGLYERDFYVMDTVIKKGIPCATVIGGGYSRNIDVLARRHSIIHRAATSVWLSNLL
ncbi:uncharacterized protein SYNPCC7002_A1628-like isoform X4 [Schistocerca piceifrons]|uniref:uncharacterized protein SYNPCC7002_A1628-like isoform X4 n=1 Tax=Schistocerca piceifrons TaxID=274613 RepID=UPI001F5EEBA5|nr:uncharacterized protein SYNPCC7002_A1628-like isoform X4 [Schistocerca piceifrons]